MHFLSGLCLRSPFCRYGLQHPSLVRPPIRPLFSSCAGQVVTNLGEKLGSDELEMMAAVCKQKGYVDEDGRISYVDFVNAEMPD